MDNSISCSKGLRYRLIQEQKTVNQIGEKQADIVRTMIRAGKKVIDLSAGDLTRYKKDGYENRIATNHLINVAHERWDTYPGFASYPGKNEIDLRRKLKQSISNFLTKYCRFNFDPEHLMLGHSVSGCFGILHKALLNPQDEICAIEPSHYVHLYNSQLLMLQSKMVTIPSDPTLNWKPNLDELRRKITDHTKAIILENPTNPQGVIYNESTLKEIINFAGEYNLPILSDETYQLITFDGLKAKTLPSLAQDVPVIVISSMTKFLMKPGWCVGYAYFHDPKGKMSEFESASKLISNTSGFGSTRIPTPIMAAAARTYEDSMEDCFQMVKEVERKRDYTTKRLNEIPGLRFNKPQCALYGLVEITEIGEKNARWINDSNFCLDILQEEGVYFFAGSSYGQSAKGYFRTLLYRNMDVLQDAYSKLEKYLKTK